MTNQVRVQPQDLINEIRTVPPEYLPNLLQMIRVFRNTALSGSESQKGLARQGGRYPLRGLPFHYIDPEEPVAVADWEAIR